MSPVPERLGFNSRRFTEVIRQSRYTREQVAVGAGVTLRTVQLWTAGLTVPQTPKMRRAAEFLGVDIEVFYDRDES